MSRLARLAPVAAGLLMLAFYLATMPHGLTWDLGGADGGELATGVYTLGLVHPPGYPTYLLLAQGQDLPDWHPLVTGDPESVHAAGQSVRGWTVSEDDVGQDLEDFVVDRRL